MSSGKRVMVINTQERAVSTDINRLQAFAARDDGEKGLVLTCPFTALRNTSGGAATASEDTTLAIQDSQA